MCHILQTIYYSTINILAAHRNNYAESIPIHRIEKSCVYQHWNHWEGEGDDTTLRARFWLLLMFLFFFVQWLLFTRGCQMMSNWFWFCRTIRTGLRYLKMLSRHDRWVPFTKVMISPKCQLEKNPGYSVQSFNLSITGARKPGTFTRSLLLQAGYELCTSSVHYRSYSKTEM